MSAGVIQLGMSQATSQQRSGCLSVLLKKNIPTIRILRIGIPPVLGRLPPPLVLKPTDFSPKEKILNPQSTQKANEKFISLTSISEIIRKKWL